MKYWQIHFIILGIILIIIAKFFVVFIGLAVTGFFLIFFGLFGIVRPYLKSPPRPERYNFRETTSDKNCSKCDSFDEESFDGCEADCEFFNIKTDKDHICDLID